MRQPTSREATGRGFKITKSHIVCEAKVRGIDLAGFKSTPRPPRQVARYRSSGGDRNYARGDRSPSDDDGETERTKERTMKPRIDYAKTAPQVRAAMLKLEQCVHQSGLDRGLLELVKLRASLINGCAYCADMHTKVARSRGETEQRLYAISLWRETPFYSERERAALTWTEAVTLVSVDHVPDDVYDVARQQFTEKELVDLTLAIVAINGWNRLAIAFRTVPGTFEVLVRPSVGDAVGVADVDTSR